MKYTIVEKELLKSIDTLNYRINKMSAHIEGINQRITNLESIIDSPSAIDYYDSSQVCRIASVSYRTIQRWRKKGIIKAKKIRNRFYYPKKEFLEVMEERINS